MIYSRPLRALLLLIALSPIGGCSSFDHDWNVAAMLKPTSATDMTGSWQGTWLSDEGGHTGGLRCLITKTGPNTYHARYAATYASILHFGYEMDLAAERQGEWVQFEGEANLGGLAGGVYHYVGHANAIDFYSTYRAESDHGHFAMKRPEEK